MRQEVIVSFNPEQRYTLLLPAASADLADDEARRWLDDEFVANDCEPLRASGKVLIADKVLVLAGTVGAPRFANDSAWAAAFYPRHPGRAGPTGGLRGCGGRRDQLLIGRQV